LQSPSPDPFLEPTTPLLPPPFPFQSFVFFRQRSAFYSFVFSFSRYVVLSRSPLRPPLFGGFFPFFLQNMVPLHSLLPASCHAPPFPGSPYSVVFPRLCFDRVRFVSFQVVSFVTSTSTVSPPRFWPLSPFSLFFPPPHVLVMFS